jgi:ribonuclease HI
MGLAHRRRRGHVSPPGGGPLGRATGNVAELAVLERLLTQMDPAVPAEIRMDSRYAMKAVTTWLPGWKRKGWKTAVGKPVASHYLVVRIDGLLQGRSVPLRPGPPGRRRRAQRPRRPRREPGPPGSRLWPAPDHRSPEPSPSTVPSGSGAALPSVESMPIPVVSAEGRKCRVPVHPFAPIAARTSARCSSARYSRGNAQCRPSPSPLRRGRTARSSRRVRGASRARGGASSRRRRRGSYNRGWHS